jgi:hypothetical protein
VLSQTDENFSRLGVPQPEGHQLTAEANRIDLLMLLEWRRDRLGSSAERRLIGATVRETMILLPRWLADEVVLLVNPVRLGKAKRLFAEGTPPRAFALESTQALPFGHRHQYLHGRWTFAEPEIRSVSDAFHDVIPKGMDQPPRMPLPPPARWCRCAPSS